MGSVQQAPLAQASPKPGRTPDGTTLFVVEVPDRACLSVDDIRSLLGQALAPEWRDAIKVTGANSDGGAYALVQEGGSSVELYVHSSYDDEEEAEQARFDCRDDASYRTTPPFFVSPLLEALGEVYYASLETVLQALGDLSYPEGPNPEAGEEQAAEAGA